MAFHTEQRPEWVAADQMAQCLRVRLDEARQAMNRLLNRGNLSAHAKAQHDRLAARIYFCRACLDPAILTRASRGHEFLSLLKPPVLRSVENQELFAAEWAQMLRRTSQDMAFAAN